MDPSGKLIVYADYTRNHDVLSGNLQTISDPSSSPSTSFADGSRLPLSTKEIGSTEIFAAPSESNFFFSIDEMQKASNNMTETYFFSSSKQTREPARVPFCFVFDAVKPGTGGESEGEER